jgi:hypothetical protein
VAPAPRPPSRATIADASVTLRRLLDAIERGELTASSGQGVALVRRLQGALTAMESVLGVEGSSSHLDVKRLAGSE